MIDTNASAPDGARPSGRLRRTAGDVVLVSALLGLSLLFLAYPLGLVSGVPPRARLLWFFDSQRRWQVLVCCWWAATALAVVALLLRRRAPVPAFVATVVAAGWHLGDNWFGASPIDLSVAVTFYAAALEARTGRRSTAMLVAGLAGCSGLAVAWQAVMMPTWERRPISVVGGWPMWAGDLVLPAVALVPAWFAASLRRSELALVEERARHLDRERDQRAALAAAAERVRISREIHDVVGNNLSIVVIQVQAAAGLLEHDPAEARQLLGQVVAVGQRSLAEVRSLLGVLRSGADPAGVRTPEVGLAYLPELIDRVRLAGVPASLRVAADPRELSTLVDLSGYRIIQEALANTVKHAGAGATVAVSVTTRGDCLEIEVVDTGRGSGGAGYRLGNGLCGVRERALALGGVAEIGAPASGGFRIHASLPLRAA